MKKQLQKQYIVGEKRPPLPGVHLLIFLHIHFVIKGDFHGFQKKQQKLQKVWDHYFRNTLGKFHTFSCNICV